MPHAGFLGAPADKEAYDEHRDFIKNHLRLERSIWPSRRLRQPAVRNGPSMSRKRQVAYSFGESHQSERVERVVWPAQAGALLAARLPNLVFKRCVSPPNREAGNNPRATRRMSLRVKQTLTGNSGILPFCVCRQWNIR